jgi:hypothetical protein
MRAHNWHALGWAIGIGLFVVFFIIWEYIGLKDRADQYQPLTWYIRKMAGTPNSPVWWILAAFLLWMLYHFLFVKH